MASVDRVAGYAVLTSLVLVCCWAWAQPVDEPCPDGYVRDPHAKCVPRSPDTAPSGTPDAGPPAIRFPPGFDLAQLPEGCRIKATASPYNGDLLLQGCDFVYFENGARLVVADANSVQISAGRGIVIGGAATIVTRGRPGASGSPGPAYPGEPWQSRGDADYWAARNQCANDPNHPDRGRPGGRGGNGQNGATVRLSHVPSTGILVIDSRGGEPGPGGSGGVGRLYRNGRNHYCDGCMWNCTSGAKGPDGARGIDGEIFVAGTSFGVDPSPCVLRDSLRADVGAISRSDSGASRFVGTLRMQRAVVDLKATASGVQRPAREGGAPASPPLGSRCGAVARCHAGS